MCAQPLKLDEELFIEFHPARWMGIDLYHPTLYTVGIELLVPRGVERVGEISALTVAAELNHLRTAVESLLGLLWVRAWAHDAANVDRAGLFRVGGIGDVVLDEFPCPPT